MKRDRASHVKGIIEGLLGKWEKGSIKKAKAVRGAWLAATDDEVNKHTTPVSLKNKRLTVIVENSVWLYKLSLEKNDILNRFNKSYTGRRKPEDIRFRVGTLDQT